MSGEYPLVITLPPRLEADYIEKGRQGYRRAQAKKANRSEVEPDATEEELFNRAWRKAIVKALHTGFVQEHQEQEARLASKNVVAFQTG